MEIELTDPNRYLSKDLVRGEPLHGCAFNGAVSTVVHLQDAVVLAHGPKSCAFITWQTISSTGRRTLFERGALLPVSLAPNLRCAELGEPEVVFGGMEKLEEKLREIKAEKPRAIVVVSACPAGIIGDDIGRVEALSEPDMPVMAIKADGNNGRGLPAGYAHGVHGAGPAAQSGGTRANRAGPVNIVSEKIVVTNTNDNFRIMSGYLARLGVRVNCRFLCETTVDALAGFCSAPLNLLAYGDYAGKLLLDFFTREYAPSSLTEHSPWGLTTRRHGCVAWRISSAARRPPSLSSTKTNGGMRRKSSPYGPR
jgi:nitrogenase molybdenum-iron protein alpha/beta subunit